MKSCRFRSHQGLKYVCLLMSFVWQKCGASRHRRSVMPSVANLLMLLKNVTVPSMLVHACALGSGEAEARGLGLESHPSLIRV